MSWRCKLPVRNPSTEAFVRWMEMKAFDGLHRGLGEREPQRRTVRRLGGTAGDRDGQRGLSDTRMSREYEELTSTQTSGLIDRGDAGWNTRSPGRLEASIE